MAKPSYKIPASMDTNYFDIEIAIQNKEGVGLKPIKVRTLMFYVIAVFAYLLVVTKTFMSDSGAFWIGLFTVFYIPLVIYLIKEDDSKRNGFQLLPVFFNYLPKRSRKVKTRTGDYCHDFISISELDEAGVEKDGVIHYLDGTVGLGFMITGSASILLFEEDKNAILNRVDKFYSKVDTEIELIIDTTKEAQRVQTQVEHVEQQFADRAIRDVPGFNKLFIEKKDMLEDYVGSRFHSIHQYMFVKAENMEMLEKFVQMFQQECSDSSMAFKRVQIMNSTEVYEYFRKLKGIE